MPSVLHCASRARSDRRKPRFKRLASRSRVAPGLVCGTILALGLVRGQPAQLLSGEPRSSTSASAGILEAIAQVPADAHVAAAADFQRTKLAALQAAAREAAAAREVAAAREAATARRGDARVATIAGSGAAVASAGRDIASARDAAAGAREVAAGSRHTKRTIYRVCRVTAYCDRGTTAAGTQSGVGQCAAPEDIPLGSKVYIPELGRTFVVTDRTHQRFRRSTVDIFVPSQEQCRRFGRNYLECEFTVPAGEPDGAGVRLARK